MSKQQRRRAFGQHFLRDQSIIAKINQTAVQLFRKNHCQHWLEIGPGRGALTLGLAECLNADESLLLVEKDRKLIEPLQTQFLAQNKKLTLIESDFLELKPEQWLSEPLGVVSNLPYSAGTAIVLELARFRKKIPVMVLMFQAEVGRRLRTPSGTKDWGSLSLWMQNIFNVELLLEVPPQAFIPPPQVDSEVVVLTPRAQALIPMSDYSLEHEAAWEKLLKASFAHRRKMLRGAFPKDSPFFEALKKTSIEGQLRAEALTWSQWEEFYKMYCEVIHL